MKKLFVVIGIILLIFSYYYLKVDITEDFSNGQELKEKDLLVLAYQLEGDLRGTFKNAYNSWLNLDRISVKNENTFSQIIVSFRNNLVGFVAEEEIDNYINKLKNINQGGEGEVAFPTHEVVNQAKLLSEDNNEVHVKFLVTRYYPATEWEGEKYQQDYQYTVTLM